jgi:carbonic anhydrase
MCEQCRYEQPAALRVSRRGLLRGGVAAAAFASIARAAHAAPAVEPVAPEEALRRLREGNARYAANTATHKDFSAGRMARARTQAPFASILSCADSRLAPELAFDQGPGALFVIRVAGNFVNEDGLASLEYGAAVLNVPLIMVLGHSDCGAVNATIKTVKDGGRLPGHLPSLVDAIRPAVTAAQEKGPADLLVEATRENVRRNVRYLEGAAPIISERVASGKLKVVGGVYDIATGNVSLLS